MYPVVGYMQMYCSLTAQIWSPNLCLVSTHFQSCVIMDISAFLTVVSKIKL